MRYEVVTSHRLSVITSMAAVMAMCAQLSAQIPEPLTRYGIAQYLAETSVNSVEDFVAGLPANHRRGFELSIDTSIHRSRDASTTAPWVVASGADSRFVLGWGTDPSRSGYDLVYWIARMGNRTHAGLIDFSGTNPRISNSPGCLRCHARASEDGTTTEPVFRTKPADDSTRDMLLQTLSEDRRVGPLEVAPLRPILQADWQPLEGIDWTNQQAGETSRFELSANNTVDVGQFRSTRASDFEVRAGSNQIEAVEFAIARLGSDPTWLVETDESAPWTLSGVSRLSRSLSALQQTGQYWMQVRALTTDEEGQRIASVPLDIAYRVENGDSPTDFGSRRSSSVTSGGGSGATPSATTLTSQNADLGPGTAASQRTAASRSTAGSRSTAASQTQDEEDDTTTVTFTVDPDETEEENNDRLNKNIKSALSDDGHTGSYTVVITSNGDGTVTLVFTPNNDP